MAAGTRRRWVWIVAGVLALLVAGGIAGFRIAVSVVKDRLVDSLGPESEISEIRMGWSSLDVVGVRIEGPEGWPASDAFRAERIEIMPSVSSALSDQLHLQSITVIRPYLSALRSGDGRLRVLPSLLTGSEETEPPDSSAAASRSVTIDRITLHDGVIELFDASVAQPPLEIDLLQVEATALDVVAPGFAGKTRFDLSAVVDGARQDGTVTIAGWAEIASRDSSLTTRLRSVELLALDAYLIRAGEPGVREGSLDLDLQSEVSTRQLHAPGRLTLSGLELAPAPGAFGTFMGLPRDAVMGALKNRRGEIAVSFILEGNLDDPKFSLNEALTTRLASSLAESLGVSLGGLATGVGSLGAKGADAVGEAAKGAVQQIFQSEEKR
jgi:hypothetical protein